jgi:hypothetical protein
LQAAAELIAEDGCGAASAAEIGRRAGYSRSMVRALWLEGATRRCREAVEVGSADPYATPSPVGLQLTRK